MIINVKIDNLKGIKKEIELSALAMNKIKRSANQVSDIDDKNKLLKSLCIIGCNGSGKTSFITGIRAIQVFITFPFRKSFKDNNNFIEQVKKLSEDEIKNLLKDLNTLNLPEQNAGRKSDKTIIELSMFIPTRDENISGIYTYRLEYNENYRKEGMLLERLSFKQSLESKKEHIVFEVSNNLESELGTTLLYQNNTIKKYDNDSKQKMQDNIVYYKSFGNEIMDFLDFSFAQSPIDLKDTYLENPERFLELSKLADEKIKKVSIKKDKEKNNEYLQFWIDDKNYLSFNQLSQGTRKVIIVGNEILNSIENSGILIIDEIEVSLHPQLAKLLVDLISFNSKNNYAQLIFSTHSPLLAFTLKDDQVVYIDDKDGKYEFSSINRAISNKTISKDKKPNKAWVEGLLIKNPDDSAIETFIEKYRKII